MKDLITAKERVGEQDHDDLKPPPWKEAGAGLLILIIFIVFWYVSTHKFNLFGVII